MAQMFTHSLHIGNEIESRMNQLNMTKAEFCRRIGIANQSANRILKAQHLSTEKLIECSEALDFNFFTLYCENQTSTQNASNHSAITNTGAVTINHNDCMFEDICKQKDKTISTLEMALADKQELIDMLKARIKECESESVKS